MTLRNLNRAKAVVLVPVAALTATIVTLEVQQQQSGIAETSGSPRGTTATPGAAPTTTPAPAATPAVTPPAGTTDTPPASVTKAGGLSAAGHLGSAVTAPLTARLSTAAVTGATSAIPAAALAAYQRAASVVDQADADCNLSWQLLAAIGHVESGDGTAGGNRLNAAGVATPGVYGMALDGRHHTQRIADTDGGALDSDATYDRAVGPMQILPATWVLIAVDGDGDGRRDPQDINDAALASAVYLCSGGGDLSTPAAQRAALLRYNHSDAYATEVLTLAATYQADAGGIVAVPATFLLPSGGAAGDDDTRPTDGAKKHHKGVKKDGKAAHGQKHGHQGHGHQGHGHAQGTGVKSVAGSGGASKPAGGTATPTPPAAPHPTPTADPTKGATGGPTGGPTGDPTTGTPASHTELVDLCTKAVGDAYPDATETAIDAAVERCTDALDELTLAQAKAGLDDVIAKLEDPDAPDGPIPGLTPDPSATAPSDPETAPSGGASTSASAGS